MLPQENLAFLMLQDCFWYILNMLVLIVSSYVQIQEESLKGEASAPPPLMKP